jgi:geranylgeranyl reductase
MAVVAPSGRKAQFSSRVGPISSIRRETFDPYLRQRAVEAGAEIMQGRCLEVCPTRDGYDLTIRTAEGIRTLRSEIVLAADGARSVVARSLRLPPPRRMLTYQERVAPPREYAERLDVPYAIHFDDRFSPDRYAWVFPQGDHLTVGTMWRDGGNPRESIRALRAESGLNDWYTNLREGCPVAYGLAPRLFHGRVLFLGDAGGLAAPATGEGIYYAMKSGALAAETVLECAEVGRFADYAIRVCDHFACLFRVLSVLERAFLHSRSQRERLAGLFERERFREIAFRGYMNKGLMCVGWWRLFRAVVRHGWSVVRR